QVSEPAVRVFRGSETGVLPHRAQPAAVHGGLHAARERVLARKAELLLVIEIVRSVEWLQLHSARRLEALLPQRAGVLRRLAVHLARPSLERRLHPLRAAGHGLPSTYTVLRRLTERPRRTPPRTRKQHRAVSRRAGSA